MRRLRWLTAAVVLLLVGCGTAAGPAASGTTPAPTGCSGADIQQVLTAYNTIAPEWHDALQLADNTPRDQLSARVADLQRIQRELEATAWPACAQAARADLLACMSQLVQVYTAFLASGDQDAARAGFATAVQRWKTFLDDLRPLGISVQGGE